MTSTSTEVFIQYKWRYWHVHKKYSWSLQWLYSYSQHLERLTEPINRKTDAYMVVSNETSNTKEQMTDTGKNVDDSHEYYAQWKKSCTPKRIYHMISLTWCHNKTNRQWKKLRAGVTTGPWRRDSLKIGVRELSVFCVLIASMCTYVCQNAMNTLLRWCISL